MIPDQDKTQRRFFIGWITVAITSLAGIAWFRKQDNAKKEQLTLLTQDGRLVQVDAAIVKNKEKKKVTKDELHTWIKPKP